MKCTHCDTEGPPGIIASGAVYHWQCPECGADWWVEIDMYNELPAVPENCIFEWSETAETATKPTGYMITYEPDNCMDCPYRGDFGCCKLSEDVQIFNYTDGVPEKCPLGGGA